MNESLTKVFYITALASPGLLIKEIVSYKNVTIGFKLFYIIGRIKLNGTFEWLAGVHFEEPLHLKQL